MSWTAARKERHAKRIKELAAQGLYKRACNKPEVLEANRQRAIERNKDSLFRKKHKAACLAAVTTPEYRLKYLAGIKNRKLDNIVATNKSARRRRAVSEGQTKNWANNPERKADAKRFKKAWWASLDKKDLAKLIHKIHSSNGVSPNKSEQRLQKIFNYLGYAYKFVGDGKTVVCRHCPDFIDEDRKEIIELNGIYWHTNRKADVCRARDYASAGYTVLLLYIEMVDRKSVRNIIKAVQIFRKGKPRYSPICKATCS